jgi:hypothetical protein
MTSSPMIVPQSQLLCSTPHFFLRETRSCQRPHCPPVVSDVQVCEVTDHRSGSAAQFRRGLVRTNSTDALTGGTGRAAAAALLSLHRTNSAGAGLCPFSTGNDASRTRPLRRTSSVPTPTQRRYVRSLARPIHRPLGAVPRLLSYVTRIAMTLSETNALRRRVADLVSGNSSEGPRTQWPSSAERASKRILILDSRWARLCCGRSL